MTINENGVSYLEKLGAEARHKQMSRSDYSREATYSYDDAEKNGKAAGNRSGHGHTVPDMNAPKTIYYGNFVTWKGGNECDTKAREIMQTRSLYSAERQYGIDIVLDTSANVAEGQYNGESKRGTWQCPVV